MLTKLSILSKFHVRSPGGRTVAKEDETLRSNRRTQWHMIHTQMTLPKERPPKTSPGGYSRAHRTKRIDASGQLLANMISRMIFFKGTPLEKRDHHQVGDVKSSNTPIKRLKWHEKESQRQRGELYLYGCSAACAARLLM